MTAHTMGRVLSFCLVAVNLKELKNTLERVCLLSEPTLKPGKPKYRERKREILGPVRQEQG